MQKPTSISLAKASSFQTQLRHTLSDKVLYEQAMMPVRVSSEQVDATLQSLRSAWDEEKMEAMLQEQYKKVLHSIIGPFGLGKVVAVFDKNGGNTTTVHNAKNKIYAKEEHEYDRAEYCGGNYNAKRKNYMDSKVGEDFTISDEYTGKTYSYKDERNRASLDCDHIISCGEHHANGGFIQTTKQRRAFAEDEANFAATDPSINRSMGEKNKMEWAKTKNSTEPEQSNADYYGVDDEKLAKTYQRGMETAQAHAPTRTDWAIYYGRELALTGAREAGKQGVTRAFGLFLTDFFDAVFAEILDMWKNGIAAGVDESSIFAGLGARLRRVAKKVVANWRKVVAEFRDGALSAFLSNMLTTFVNTFITTGKRVVRMLREGFFSFLQAAKLILFRPEGMSMADAADAASKLLVGGGIIYGGILLEEFLEKSLMTSLAAVPVLNVFAPQIIAVLTGGLTAVGGALAMYALDRFDLFGVNAKKRHDFIVAELDARIAVCDAGIEATIANAGVEFVTIISPQGEKKLIAQRRATVPPTESRCA